jgi:adenine phosphoribosyltransferase
MLSIFRYGALTVRFRLKDGEMDAQKIAELKAAIREVPDWPKKGILFYDVTTLLKQARCFEQTINALLDPYKNNQVDLVLGIEARGFIFAPTVAYALKAGFVPVRKPGKLPAAKLQVNYELEYGMDCLEIHQDAVQPGQRVLIVDDLIATGGTARAVAEMVETMEATVVGFAFVVELSFLHGRDKLAKYDIHSILKY